MTPRELITAGECAPSCLAAITSSRACRCPCRGAHHGLVADCDITAVLDARRSGLHQLSDLELINQ